MQQLGPVALTFRDLLTHTNRRCDGGPAAGHRVNDRRGNREGGTLGGQRTRGKQHCRSAGAWPAARVVGCVGELQRRLVAIESMAEEAAGRGRTLG